MEHAVTPGRHCECVRGGAEACMISKETVLDRLPTSTADAAGAPTKRPAPPEETETTGGEVLEVVAASLSGIPNELWNNIQDHLAPVDLGSLVLASKKGGL